MIFFSLFTASNVAFYPTQDILIETLTYLVNTSYIHYEKYDNILKIDFQDLEVDGNVLGQAYFHLR